jgi:K+-transporting ATPase KdpF subunit
LLRRCRVHRGCVVYLNNYAGRDLHRHGDFIFRGVRDLRAHLRETLIQFMENIILGIISVALCGYLIFAMVRPEKF